MATASEAPLITACRCHEYNAPLAECSPPAQNTTRCWCSWFRPPRENRGVPLRVNVNARPSWVLPASLGDAEVQAQIKQITGRAGDRPVRCLGPYVVGRTLGRGTFSKVRLGLRLPLGNDGGGHNNTTRLVALKFYFRSCCERKRHPFAFGEEMAILTCWDQTVGELCIAHACYGPPNLVRVHEVLLDETHDLWVAVMDYAGEPLMNFHTELEIFTAGGGVAYQTETTEVYTEEGAKVLLRDTLAALARLHEECDVVHKDVKPPNLLRHPTRPKLPTRSIPLKSIVVPERLADWLRRTKQLNGSHSNYNSYLSALAQTMGWSVPKGSDNQDARLFEQMRRGEPVDRPPATQQTRGRNCDQWNKGIDLSEGENKEKNRVGKGEQFGGYGDTHSEAESDASEADYGDDDEDEAGDDDKLSDGSDCTEDFIWSRENNGPAVELQVPAAALYTCLCCALNSRDWQGWTNKQHGGAWRCCCCNTGPATDRCATAGDNDAEVTLVDLNSASQSTQPDLPIYDAEGTRWFTSPECFHCAPGMPRNGKLRDAWSVGCLTYVLLFGRPPFRSSNEAPIATILSIKKDSLEWPEEAEISDAAKHFISSLLEKEPENRMTTLQALQHPWLIENAVY